MTDTFRFHIAEVNPAKGMVFTYEGPVLVITAMYDEDGEDTDDPAAAEHCIAEYDGMHFPIRNISHMTPRVLH